MTAPSLQPEKPPSPEVVVITGMAGAGRTTAAHALEDHGWYVVENMPPQLFVTLADLVARSPEAFARVAASRPELTLVMAGPDADGWRAQLEAQAAQRGVAERIVWPGMLQGDAKWGAFHAADVFVLPGHRGNGLGKDLVRVMVDEGPGSRFRWMLHTADAHGLYRGFGFGDAAAGLAEATGHGVQGDEASDTERCLGAGGAGAAAGHEDAGENG